MLKMKLEQEGFSKKQIIKIEKIIKEEKTDINDKPMGTIAISFDSSRSRLGISLIARALKKELEKANYKVNYNFFDEKNNRHSTLIQEKITNIYNKSCPVSFQDLLEPRAIIEINIIENNIWKK